MGMRTAGDVLDKWRCKVLADAFGKALENGNVLVYHGGRVAHDAVPVWFDDGDVFALPDGWEWVDSSSWFQRGCAVVFPDDENGRTHRRWFVFKDGEPQQDTYNTAQSAFERAEEVLRQYGS